MPRVIQRINWRFASLTKEFACGSSSVARLCARLVLKQPEQMPCAVNHIKNADTFSVIAVKYEVVAKSAHGQHSQPLQRRVACAKNHSALRLPGNLAKGFFNCAKNLFGSGGIILGDESVDFRRSSSMTEECRSMRFSVTILSGLPNALFPIRFERRKRALATFFQNHFEFGLFAIRARQCEQVFFFGTKTARFESAFDLCVQSVG